MRILEKKQSYLIKNLQEWEPERHFTWNTVNVIWFLLSFAAGVSLAAARESLPDLGIETGLIFLSPLLLLLGTLLLARWELAFILIAATSLWAAAGLRSSAWLFLASYWIGGVGLMFQMAKEWERVIVLRLGKFHKVKGPGLFLLVPFMDAIAKKVDLRIRVTDFAAETTLTRDSVPVTVDALCFWLVWDAEKAVLEVENYVEAVVLSSQTALRAAISNNDLTTLMANGEKIEEEIRQQVDRKTTEWGITIQHIEATEIKIPAELQETMSHIARAEREKKAHILLSEAEKEIAARLEEASRTYKENPIALSLKKLGVLQDAFEKGNSMVLVPSRLPEDLDEESVFGLKALSELRKADIGRAKPGSSKEGGPAK